MLGWEAWESIMVGVESGGGMMYYGAAGNIEV